jgi:hypothetical protein
VYFILAVPLLVFAVVYPTAGIATALSFIVGVGDATAQSGIFVSFVSCDSARAYIQSTCSPMIT